MRQCLWSTWDESCSITALIWPQKIEKSIHHSQWNVFWKSILLTFYDWGQRNWHRKQVQLFYSAFFVIRNKIILNAFCIKTVTSKYFKHAFTLQSKYALVSCALHVPQWSMKIFTLYSATKMQFIKRNLKVMETLSYDQINMEIKSYNWIPFLTCICIIQKWKKYWDSFLKAWLSTNRNYFI